jgi:hypothetical protein
MSEESIGAGASGPHGAGERGDAAATDGGDEGSDVSRETVRDAFVDAAPRTTSEVATAVGSSPDAVTEVLAALEAGGDLRRTDVGDHDPTTLWYLPAATVRERETEGLTEADDDIGVALARMSFPGASRMMQDWRRDAVRAVVEHLRAGGPETAGEITDAVYPPHAAGYDEPEAWWDCVRPRLLSVPGIVHEDGEWAFGDR